MNCPSCGIQTVSGARFCHNCGYPVTGQQYSSTGSPILSEGERRVVTMLFCDVKGSTSMAELLDPEEWAEIMNSIYGYLIPPIYRYQGVVVRLMGDAILAFFGAPVAHEDDPQQAVRAGLDIVEGIRPYRKRLSQERSLDFDVRVGINTGLVVVGAVGSAGKLEYTAMGDAINLAARMEQTAAPGTVQVSQETFRLVEPYFEAESLGEIEVKGKREPVRAYRITGLKPASGHSPALLARRAPLVGRQAEMALLQRAVEKVQGGSGQIVCLTGEAGLGKTRLIEELRAAWQANLAGQTIYIGEVRGVSYAALRPYEQFRQHLKAMAGILETDSPPQVRARLESMLAYASPGLRSRAMTVYPALLNAENLGRPGERRPSLEGEAFKHELFDVVKCLIAELAGDSPGIIVLDDLHWIDPASAELLEYQLRLAREKSLLILCAFRPDPQAHAWRIKETAAREYSDCYTDISLGPLPSADAKVLIDHLLPEGQVPLGARQSLQDRILERAEGNPLFIEEVVVALRNDQTPSTEEPEVPGSLQALLLARLDRLAEGPRHLIQIASVVGRKFSYTVLRQLQQDSLSLEDDLQALEHAGMIREETYQPELQYAFRHALTQETVYGSILHKRRREIHAKVGETLELLSAGHPEDWADQIAHHFGAAGDTRAVRYYLIAGEQARRLYANEAALSHFTHALEIAQAAPSGSLTGEIIQVLRGRGNLFFFLARFREAIADMQQALQLARSERRAAEETRLLAELAMVTWMHGQGSEGLALAQEAEAKAQAIGDPALSLHAAVILATAIQNEGKILAAHERTRQAWVTSRKQKDRLMEAHCLHYLAMQNNYMGRFGRAAALAREATSLYLRLGEKWVAVHSLLFQSLAEGGRGNYETALETLEASRAMAEEISSPWLARYYNQRAWLSAELGDWESAHAYDLAGLEPARLLQGHHVILISTQINLALDCLALRQFTEAEGYLSEAEKNLGKPEFASHNWRWRTRLADARARLFLARGQLTEAHETVEHLLAWSAHTHAGKYTARGLLLRAQIALAARSPAEGDLLGALKQADSLCYLPVRIEARRELSSLYANSAQPEKSFPLQDEIDRRLSDLDSSLEHPDLRLAFERGLARSGPSTQ